MVSLLKRKKLLKEKITEVRTQIHLFRTRGHYANNRNGRILRSAEWQCFPHRAPRTGLLFISGAGRSGHKLTPENTHNSVAKTGWRHSASRLRPNPATLTHEAPCVLGQVPHSRKDSTLCSSRRHIHEKSHRGMSSSLWSVQFVCQDVQRTWAKINKLN